MGTCTAPPWDATKAYATGEKVSLNGKEYVARFYTLGDNPETNHEPEMGPVQGKPWTFPTTC
jgi:chitodextrinase